MILLLFLHHLADAYQPSWLIESKKKHLFSIYEHSFVWAGAISLGLLILGGYSVYKFIFLLLGHLTIDYFKYKKKEYFWTYVDQALHYVQIFLVWYN